MEFWSDLQYQSWPNVVAYYDPHFRAYVGTTNLVGAKKLSASSFPRLKPQIVRVSTSRGETTVYYTLRLEDGSKELASSTWRQEGGNWQIIYESRLDAELSQLAQNQVMAKSGSTPSASSHPTPAAVRAGNAAAQVQAHFLQDELKTTPP